MRFAKITLATRKDIFVIGHILAKTLCDYRVDYEVLAPHHPIHLSSCLTTFSINFLHVFGLTFESAIGRFDRKLSMVKSQLSAISFFTTPQQVSIG
jgi:hypothetical protein